MKKVFLDIGACQGESVRFFKEHYPQAPEFEIWCIEPLSVNCKIIKEAHGGVNVVEAAAWTFDGEVKLYLGKHPKNSTMFGDKTTGRVDQRAYVVVRCIDIAEFMVEHFTAQDEIWMKLNVEGAEYGIIAHLCEKGLLPWINKLFVMWHARKIPSLQARHAEVERLVPNAIPLWRKKAILPL